MKKGLVLAVVSLLTLSLLSGCGSTNTASNNTSNKSKKKYVIATDATYAPFEFQKTENT